jgi:hypothetical protein
LQYRPVEHRGNQNSSPEEGEAIGKMVVEILDSSTTWIDRHGTVWRRRFAGIGDDGKIVRGRRFRGSSAAPTR